MERRYEIKILPKIMSLPEGLESGHDASEYLNEANFKYNSNFRWQSLPTMTDELT